MKKIFTLVVLVVAAAASYAAPARLGWQKKIQPDGTSIEVQLVGDEFCHYWINRNGQTVQADENGYWMPADKKAMRRIGDKAKRRDAAMRREGEKAIGSPRGIVILVNFKDESFQAANTQSAMSDMINGENYNYEGATGSLRKYFADQSYGKYTPEFDVVGPVTLPHDMSHYGGNDSEGNDLLAGDMIVEACSIANALHNVDFTQYDNDEDEYVDFVYVLYAGLGEADGGAENTVWPHAWVLKSSEYYNNCSYNSEQRIFDGVNIDRYACSGELTGIKRDGVVVEKVRAGIGTMAHEFSHVIGLHDLYDTKYGPNDADKMTPGAWHIMDDGSYNNNGKTPPNYTIFDKYLLGWVTPENPGGEAQMLTMAAGEGYQLANCDTLVSATSYHTLYYIENRQQEGWDAHAPGHGLLVWKIMYNPFVWDNNAINSTTGYIRYALVSATGNTTKIGSAADPFPGTQNMTSWTGLRGRALTDISESDGVIKLNYVADTGDGPIGPEELLLEDLHLAKASYYTIEGVKYYYFDVYKGEDETTEDMLYPEITFTIVANSKTAINGTYDIINGDFWRSTSDVVARDETQPASISIQHVNEQGDYAMKGWLVGIDGVKYVWDAVVHVWARDTENDFIDITLKESGTPSGVENTGVESSARKILRNGQLVILRGGKEYSVIGARRAF